MRPYYTDLHIHSKFSRATSPQCNLNGLQHWAQIKGVTVCGSGDCTHPGWFAMLKETLVQDDTSELYHLNAKAAEQASREIPESCRSQVEFIITGEISSIYKRGGKVRKVHSVVILPSIEVAGILNKKLTQIGNIISDGRPILGLDPRDLLEIMLEIDPRCALIPAHIWTPWFSVLGAKSGFDSLEECFGDLTKHIFAVETGLSSDAPMNHRIPFLQDTTLISNSDLHSPSNLGRNATRFFGTPSYSNIIGAMKSRSPELFGGTVDLFPEEGKYHYDGHRSCGVSLSPEQSIEMDNLCPACGKPLTIGVLHRVIELEKLHKRVPSTKQLDLPPFQYIIPLPELLSHKIGNSPKSKRVQRAYNKIIEQNGPELPLLLDAKEEQLDNLEDTGEMICQVRQGNVNKTPGFDGIYGSVKPVITTA
ncbi:MAG: endonuclease Q family protein [Kiritimatiellia bacterium]